MEKKKFYITTPIYYPSDKLHIGHTYCTVATDAMARYKRLTGCDVMFLTGTDEHGQKIEDKAKAAGKTPKEFLDEIVEGPRGILDLWKLMNISNDRFIRTTDDYHVASIQKIFRRMYDKGDIYKGTYRGKYCKPCESFWTESQLVDGKCPDCGREVTDAEEEAYFFRLSKYADRVRHLLEDTDFLEPRSRVNEMVNNFIKPGLEDLCVSRTSIKWGIPVTFDPRHVTYVWLDALVNYITAIGYDPDKTYGEQSEEFRRLWPADVHIIGKDILRFHSIYWPIFLMALDMPLPKKIFAHPWFNFGTDKMSKSRGNVIYADELAEKFTVDGVRYYALSEMPYSADGSITYESVISRFNTDLVNNLGNLVKRTLDMQKKYFDRVVAAPVPADTEAERVLDAELAAACAAAYDGMVANMETYHVADAVSCVFALLSRTNKYIDETAPWALAKDESRRDRLGTVLYNLLEAIRQGAVLLKPFIPATAEEILDRLHTDARGFDTVGRSFGGMKPGVQVEESRVLFARVDEKTMLAQLEAERADAAAAPAPETAPDAAEPTAQAAPERPEGVAQIGYEDFMKVELRTAAVLACEPVKKAKKLLKLRLDLGYEQRQVVSGIAKWYKPEDLLGKKVIVVANLAPATLCGVESEGMILASGEDTVRVIFLDPETPLGERIR